MPKEAIEPEAEVLETPEIEEAETVEQEAPEQVEPEPSDEEGEEETVIGFADEESDDPDADQDGDSPAIKAIRARNRDLNKRAREAERRAAELEQSKAPAKIKVGPKPTLESCDWDETKFETELDAWKEGVAKANEQEEKAQESVRKVKQSYERDLENYHSRKATIGIPDFDDAEATVIAALSLEQQAVALQAANDPATMIAALGKSPAKLAELAKIDNPWKLAAAIARLEGQVKVVKTKKAPPPDRAQRGSASMAPANADKELEKLEKEAEQTGNRTKVIAYKKQMKSK